MSPDDPSVLAKVLRKHINFGTTDPDEVYAGSVPVKNTAGLFAGADVEAVLAEIAGSGRTTETLKNLADAIEALNEYAAELAADLADHVAETIDDENSVHGLVIISSLNYPLE
jgi:glucose-6-phosphate isomerase